MKSVESAEIPKFDVAGLDIEGEDSTIVYIGLALAFLAIFYVLYTKLFSTRKSGVRRHVLICGPVSTGKSAFFYNLASGKNQMTVSSMKVNEYRNLELKSDDAAKPVTFDLMDIPGVGYFRSKIIEMIDNAKIILLFIDSADRKCLNEASEFVYDIVNNESFDESLELVIACNKSDDKFAKGKAIIENELTAEVESKKLMKQKNNLDDQSNQIGKLFSLKAKFSFKTFSNISFIETTKEDNFQSLKNKLKETEF